MKIGGRTFDERSARLAMAFRDAASRCPTGKIGHKRRRDAEAEATRLNRRRPMTGPAIPANAYCCWHCGSWHVGRPKFRLQSGRQRA